MTGLRVTIVVALGLTGVVALWLLAVLVAGGFQFALNTSLPAAVVNRGTVRLLPAS